MQQEKTIYSLNPARSGRFGNMLVQAINMFHIGLNLNNCILKVPKISNSKFGFFDMSTCRFIDRIEDTFARKSIHYVYFWKVGQTKHGVKFPNYRNKKRAMNFVDFHILKLDAPRNRLHKNIQETILNKDTLVIHVRGTDVYNLKLKNKDSKWGGIYAQPPLAFYIKVIEENNINQLILLSDCKKGNPIVAKLKEIYPSAIIPYHQNMIQDFNTIRYARNFCCSTSSFATTACLHSNCVNKTIFCYPYLWDRKHFWFLSDLFGRPDIDNNTIFRIYNFNNYRFMPLNEDTQNISSYWDFGSNKKENMEYLIDYSKDDVVELDNNYYRQGI